MAPDAAFASRDRRLAHIERPAQVDVEDGLLVSSLDVHDLQRLRDAGIVDQNVDPAELGDDAVDRGDAGGLVGDVAGKAPMAFADLGRRGLRLRLVEIEDATRPPCLANTRAVARPMPRRLAAPEITATLPASSMRASLVSVPQGHHALLGRRLKCLLRHFR